MNPKNFEIIEGSEFKCDSCKNEKSLPKIFNNNNLEQMGMLAFSDNLSGKVIDTSKKDPIVSPKQKSRPQSILGKCQVLLIFEIIIY